MQIRTTAELVCARWIVNCWQSLVVSSGLVWPSQLSQSICGRFRLSATIELRRLYSHIPVYISGLVAPCGCSPVAAAAGTGPVLQTRLIVLVDQRRKLKFTEAY